MCVCVCVCVCACVRACACVCVCMCVVGLKSTHLLEFSMFLVCINKNSCLQEVGVDKQTHKDLRKVPDDLLPALEEHLSELDSIRKANASQPRYSVCKVGHGCRWIRWVYILLMYQCTCT